MNSCEEGQNDEMGIPNYREESRLNKRIIHRRIQRKLLCENLRQFNSHYALARKGFLQRTCLLA